MLRQTLFGFALVFAFTAAHAAGTIEKPAVVDGTIHAVIAPIFNNAAASQSYIRLFNGGAATADFVVKVVGSPSGNVYGTATIPVPANASPQFKITLLLSMANAGALTGGDDAYALYLQSGEAKAGYQHVTYNAATTLFENASACAALINEVMGATSGRVLTNVHTSRLGGYPSNIYIHNYRNVPVTYRISVVDAGAADGTSGAIRAGSGAIIGSQDVLIGANTTYTKPFSFFENALSWTPASTQFHANLIITNPNGGTSYDTISQAISNAERGGEINMTAACAVNPPAAAAATAATTFAGTIAGNGGASGTLTVTVETTLAAASAPLLAPTSAVEKPQALSNASGVLKVTGATTVALTGTYDSATGALILNGSGYTFTGNAANGIYSGSYTGPNNGKGGFSALNATLSPVTRYCGTWHTTEADDNTGTFNIQITTSGTLSGVTYGGAGVTLTGQKTGNSISGQSSENVHFNGTVSTAGTISGTFVPTGGGSGTFSGTTCS